MANCDVLLSSTPLASCHNRNVPLGGVGGITIQYPAHLYSPVLVPTVIPQFSFMAQRFFDHEIQRKSHLQSTHLFTSIIPFSKSIPNSDAIMPSNRADFYDHNGTTFNSLPILEAEIRKLPVLLFTPCFSATASIPDMYYRSFGRYFRGDPDTVEIVGIGSGEVEIFEPQVGSIELVGCSKGK